MRQPSAIAASVANSTALRFRTGKAPGMPRHTGQTFVLGGSPKRVEQEQKIFEAVSSWTWTSRPITGSYFARISSEMADVVAIKEDYRRVKRAFVVGVQAPRIKRFEPKSDSLTASSLPARSDISPSEFRNTSAHSRRSRGRRSHKNS